MKKFFSKNRPDYILVSVILTVMVLTVFVNIVMRAITGSSLRGTEEITTYLFVWLVVLGSGIAFERGAHLGMSSIYRYFPVKIQKLVLWLSCSLAILMFVFIDVLLIRNIYREIHIYHACSVELNVPLWIYYAGAVLFSPAVFFGVLKGTFRQINELGGSH
jgi:TRAP-type C4-dicarboxylate transport system permease small subunit